jgi:mRNA-degrading endonuclease RelE of RelBE toxin-antitoxin system
MTIIMVIMPGRRPFELVYDPEVKAHIRAIETKYHSLIRTTLETQLRFEPDTETRNRKPLERQVEFEASWELRFGPDNRFRVFYAVSHERHEVEILAIGVKERNRLRIGGEEIKL